MSTLRTKDVVENEPIYNQMPTITNVRKDMLMDFSRIYDKPYLIDTGTWDTTAPASSLLIPIGLPAAMLTNTTARIPFDMSCLYRLGGCVMVQVSGTVQHQGLILVGVIPYDAPTVTNPNQLLMGPHAFLNANESTSVCIELPYYSRHHLNKTNPINLAIVADNDRNFARVEFFVMSPLRTTATGSTSISITTHIKLNQAEFYIPKITPGVYAPQSFASDLYKIPTKIFDGLAVGAKTVTGDFIDALRKGLRTFTGFHNPNSPAINQRVLRSDVNFINNIDQPTLYEKLDPFAQHDRIVRDFQFNTTQDEMDMRYLLSKPVWLGKFGVSTATPAGKILFNIPISPMVEFSDTNYFSPMRLAYESSRYWRGSLKLHIQAVSTNFHFTKILVAKDYTSSSNSLTTSLTLASVHNMPTDTLEFSGGGQIQTIDLPFCAQDEQLECSRDTYRNGLQHGVVHGYLVQPLVTSGAVPTAIEFHIYMSGGPDLQFYGYSTDPINRLNDAAALAKITEEIKTNKVMMLKSAKKESEVVVKVRTKKLTMKEETEEISSESDPEERLQLLDDTISKEEQDELKQRYKLKKEKKGSLRRFFMQSGEAETMLSSSGQADVMIDKISTAQENLRCDDFHPIVSVRDYVRRMQLVEVIPVPLPASLTYVYPVSNVFRSKTPFGAFCRLYHGMTGGLKLRAVVTITGPVRTPLVKYLPPGTWLAGGATLPTPTAPIDFTLLPETTVDSISTTMRQDYAFRTSTVGNISQFTYEFVIPNMSPKRFITPGLPGFPSDLGFLLFTNYALPGAEMEIKIFASLGDEARLGYQVTSEGYSVPVSAGARLTLYGMGAPLIFSPLSFPGIYYFNPVV